jgi:dienelactone hydrolase
MGRLLAGAALLLLAACDSGGDEGRCVAADQALAMPSPLWRTEDGLTPPEDDMAAGMLRLRRPTWYEQLAQADGWPARPTIIVPLDGAGQAVSVDRLSFVGRRTESGRLESIDVGVSAVIDGDGASLVVRPDVALPELYEAVLVVGPGAVTGASALPVCGSDGEPHPDYDRALSELPAGTEAELALPFRLATTHRQLPALGEALAARPVLTVRSAMATGLDRFGESSPSPEVAALLQDPAVTAILELPDYRGPDGAFSVAADGVPQAQGITAPGIIVVLPVAGEPPYPFVLFQHGGGQDKSVVFGLAGPLAAAGFALVAIDLPEHGDRTSGSAGTDMDILDFNDLPKTRDNLRQAAADHMAVLTGIDALNDELGPMFGDIVPLDPDRGFYLGLSLGGITGSMTFASAPTLEGAALFVGGADYVELVSFGFFSLLVSDILARPSIEQAVVLGLAEAILDGADPQAYAVRAEDRTGPPRPLLLMQAIDDPIVSMPSSDLWGRSFGADLVRPFHHEVDGMDELDLPASDNFAWDGESEAVTRVLVQNPMAETPISERHGGLIMLDYTQQVVEHCFTTVLDDGSCEVIDTGFAEH